jgi:hypothetical protein
MSVGRKAASVCALDRGGIPSGSRELDPELDPSGPAAVRRARNDPVVEERDWLQWLAADVRIAVHTTGRPVERYVIRLEVLDSGAWQTVHLFDNAHGQHDSHRYRSTEKQPAEPLPARTVADAIPTALRLLTADWERIIERWRQTHD